MRIAGAIRVRRSSLAAATRSATLEENVVLANSPSLEPRPVKSKRSGDAERGQAFGDALGGVDVLAAGEAMREQRSARHVPTGASSSAASFCPLALGKSSVPPA
jgi:hypothetical protein